MAKKKASKKPKASAKRTAVDDAPIQWTRGKARRPSRVTLDWQDRAAAKCISRDGNVEYTIVETPEGDAHLTIDCGLLASVAGAKRVADIISRVLQSPDGLCRDLENLDPKILDTLGQVDHADSLIIAVSDVDDEILGDEGGFAQPGS